MKRFFLEDHKEIGKISKSIFKLVNFINNPSQSPENQSIRAFNWVLKKRKKKFTTEK
jgi:hypothetical protein